jgi:hypothetical protein
MPVLAVAPAHRMYALFEDRWLACLVAVGSGKMYVREVEGRSGLLQRSRPLAVLPWLLSFAIAYRQQMFP